MIWRITAERWAGVIPLLCAITGCAHMAAGIQDPQAVVEPVPTVELDNVAFYPQEQYQCGPAALATVLDWSGVKVTAQDLVSQVYLPGRKGSLQLEILATARRYQRVAYVIAPTMSALFTELASGHPVLILQNLGLQWLPQWHYAVVVGVNAEHNEVVLRSDVRRRHVLPLDLFEKTWRRAQAWGVVVLPPQTLPATAEPLPYLQSAAQLEHMGFLSAARVAYLSALKSWPQHAPSLVALGNVEYQLGRWQEADLAYQRAIASDPQMAVAYNNLAQLFLEQRRLTEAETLARQAIALGGPLREQFEETLSTILRQRH